MLRLTVMRRQESSHLVEELIERCALPAHQASNQLVVDFVHWGLVCPAAENTSRRILRRAADLFCYAQLYEQFLLDR